ncbi:MAG: hypothetical protein WBW33_23745 [Bryobacteraceae bacterium]
MTPKLLRLAYVLEFLVAIIAVFTAWSEIGGQAALDLMHWGWKMGLSLVMAGSIVAYTEAIITEDSLWNPRAARRLTLLLLTGVAMGLVTFYYFMQEDTGDNDEPDGTQTSLTTVPQVFRAS